MNQVRRSAFNAGALVGSAVGFAAVLLHFVWLIPTSDLRTRIYILLPSIAWVYFAATGLIGLAVVGAVGLRDRWSLLGGAVGGMAAAALLFTRVYEFFLWRFEPEVTLGGQWLRTAGAVVLVVIAILALRMGGLRRSRGQVLGGKRQITSGCCLRGLRPLRSIRRTGPGAGDVFVVSKRVELLRPSHAGSAAFPAFTNPHHLKGIPEA